MTTQKELNAEHDAAVSDARFRFTVELPPGVMQLAAQVQPACGGSRDALPTERSAKSDPS